MEELALLLKEKLEGVDVDGFMVRGTEGGRREERSGSRLEGQGGQVSSRSFRCWYSRITCSYLL